MGSRAVVVVCRDEDVARDALRRRRRRHRHRVHANGTPLLRGCRRSRRELLTIVASALERSGFWERLATDWAVLDCELMPWSAKAQELIRKQYAAVGAAATRCAA